MIIRFDWQVQSVRPSVCLSVCLSVCASFVLFFRLKFQINVKVAVRNFKVIHDDKNRVWQKGLRNFCTNFVCIKRTLIVFRASLTKPWTKSEYKAMTNKSKKTIYLMRETSKERSIEGQGHDQLPKVRTSKTRQTFRTSEITRDIQRYNECQCEGYAL